MTDIASKVYDGVKAVVAVLYDGHACAYGPAPVAASGLPCFAVSPKGDAPMEKRYLDGRKVCSHSFYLTLRIAATGDEACLDAVSKLNAVAKRLESEGIDLGEGRKLWSISRESLPACVAETAADTEAGTAAYSDWRTVLKVAYQEEG